MQIATDCNENIRRAENEMKLFAISKRFPHDEVEVVSARWITKNGECTDVCPQGQDVQISAQTCSSNVLIGDSISVFPLFCLQ